jgi:hypothetical protein
MHLQKAWSQPWLLLTDSLNLKIKTAYDLKPVSEDVINNFNGECM